MNRLFWRVFWISLAVRFLTAWVAPLTGDEAYYATWGMFPRLGYFDHPPMVGWWLSALYFFGHHKVWLRLPAILVPSVVGWLIPKFFDREKSDEAQLTGALFLLAPIPVFGAFITSDTPLILFTFLSVYLFFRAEKSRDNAIPYYLGSGLMLGLALLSKYFAALIPPALIVHWLAFSRNRKTFSGLVFTGLAALPFIAFHLIWNYQHCWGAMLFNVFLRNTDEHYWIGHFYHYVEQELYLLTPFLLYYFVKNVRRWRELPRLSGKPAALIACAFLVPNFLIARTCFDHGIGLHFTLSFYAFYFLLAGFLFSRRDLWRSVLWMGGLSAVHLVVIAVLLTRPLETWKDKMFYHGAVFFLNMDKIAEKVRSYGPGFEVATDAYVLESMASYTLGRHVAVMGEGSDFARQDDTTTDFREWQGKNVILLWPHDREPQEMVQFFDRVTLEKFPVRELQLTILVGYGFRYERYRDVVLAAIRRHYYHFPTQLPVGGCGFDDKYFPGALYHF